MIRNRLLAAMLCGVILGLWPLWAARAASFVIELKNGRQVTTERYWIEGDQVKFQTSAGTLGFSKDAVRDIREAETEEYEVVKPAPVAPQDSQQPPQAGTTAAKTVPETPQTPASVTTPGADQGAGTSAGADDVEYYRQKRNELKAKIDEHIEQFLQASGEKDAEEKHKARQEYLRYSEQLYELQEELKEKNGGELPDWWEEI